MDDGKTLYTVEEVRQRWAISRTHLYEMLGRELPYVKLGKSTRIHKDDLLAIEQSHRVPSRRPTDAA